METTMTTEGYAGKHMASERLKKQLLFAAEIDQLKQVFRQTYLLDGTRKENAAEHSWNFALLAVLLAEYAADKIDVLRVVKMILIHDLVEIDAGDTYCYEQPGNTVKEERERAAADRIFGLLPDDQADEFRRLWDEFEARETADARYAAALDRLQPLLANYWTDGRSWQEHGVDYETVRAGNAHMELGAPELWRHVEDVLDDAVKKGYLNS